MKKILITGFSGFVAYHFIKYLYNESGTYKIYGIDIHYPAFDYKVFNDRLDIQFKVADMTQTVHVWQSVSEFCPDYILHLAAYSSVAYSWEHPSESFMNNSNIFLNLISVVRDVCPQSRILSVGSSEEYGNVAHSELPVSENHSVAPLSPYAVARVSQEMLSRVFVDAYGMEIVMTRSFNHIGPGQDERFVIPGFIKKIFKIKQRGRSEGVIETGDLSIVRDFVDVRDVVRGYYLLLLHGRKGEIYNICSGRGIALSEAVTIIADKAGVKVTAKTNPMLVRPNDHKEIVGVCDKMESETGWKRRYAFGETIQDMIDEYLENHNLS